MAGALESPGDSIAPTLTKPLSKVFITKSPLSPTARRPQNDVIHLLSGSVFTLLFASAIIFLKPSSVTDVSSLSSISSAVGPKIILQSTVGETKIPLPILLGVWKMVCFARYSHSLSKSMYSPHKTNELPFYI